MNIIDGDSVPLLGQIDQYFPNDINTSHPSSVPLYEILIPG